MLIQCFNERYDVLDIPMGGTLIRNQPDPVQVRKGLQRVWRFSRDGTGDLVCDVTHEDDIRRFLSIRQGYQPYGEEARAEAEETYRWREYVPAAEAEDTLAPGQPPVTLEMLDDDDDDLGDLTPDPDDDDDDGEGLPEIPAADADGQLWINYAGKLVANPQDKDLLETYARENYGVDLDKRRGILVLIKEIAKLQAAA